MELKTLSEADVKGKRVLVRVDFNVPCGDGGAIEDDSRVIAALPTIQHLMKEGAKVILMSHFGRPKGQIVEEMRLTNVAKCVEDALGSKIQKLDDCIGPEVEKAIEAMKDGDVVLLENVRFHPGEEKNDPAFCEELAKLGDIFVNDAFGAAHRKHASTAGLAEHLPAYAGLLMEKEITTLSTLFKDAKKPICLIVGGAKIDTKIGIIRTFVDIADYILVGGALANTFLAARGFDIGESKYEEDKLEVAQEIMLEADKAHEPFKLPRDVVVASEISEEAQKLDLPLEDIEGDMKIVDIGKVTIKRYSEIVAEAGTIIWNGPMGIHEFNRFSHGSKRLAEAIIDSSAVSIIGGGDTIDCLKRYDYPLEKFNHVSTGGGAMIEFLEGKTLPGIEILLKSA